MPQKSRPRFAKTFTSIELIGLQQIIANKDLRNLELSEKYTSKRMQSPAVLFEENPSWNFDPVKEKGPISYGSSAILLRNAK